ncbi:MAG: RsmD family RNA methyltransferase [Synergistaceae bacterium]|jgi:16S rRNA (guanine(966)-N(2))-methyltransferase RsmD|nr:RsmD family RNA methyltransferase [Synergistaceae bacterium]
MKDVRPTSGRVLLALFNILGGDALGEGLGNAAFLDLFAGTGRVGIEALRRGASFVVMVEVSRDRAREVERVVAGEFAESGRAVVLSLELRRAVAWLLRRERTFDVVFADPPYNQGWGKALLHTKGLTELLRPEGVLVVEHASREALDVPAPWVVTDSRFYGETALTFLKKT